MSVRLACALAVTALIGSASAQTVTPGPTLVPGNRPADGSAAEALNRLVARAALGPVRVIVRLTTPFQPEGQLSGAEAVARQREAIAADQAALKVVLEPHRPSTFQTLATVPMAIVETGHDGLMALLSSRLVGDVQEDSLARPMR
jgi:hypothetical protein